MDRYPIMKGGPDAAIVERRFPRIDGRPPSGSAMAQTAAERAACQADFEKFCPASRPAAAGRSSGGRRMPAKQLDKLTSARRSSKRTCRNSGAGDCPERLKPRPLHLADGIGTEILQARLREIAWRISACPPDSASPYKVFASDDLLLLVLGQRRLQRECRCTRAQEQVGPEHRVWRTRDVDELGAREEFQEMAYLAVWLGTSAICAPRKQRKLLDEGKLMRAPAPPLVRS